MKGACNFSDSILFLTCFSVWRLVSYIWESYFIANFGFVYCGKQQLYFVFYPVSLFFLGDEQIYIKWNFQCRKISLFSQLQKFAKWKRVPFLKELNMIRYKKSSKLMSCWHVWRGSIPKSANNTLQTTRFEFFTVLIIS